MSDGYFADSYWASDYFASGYWGGILTVTPATPSTGGVYAVRQPTINYELLRLIIKYLETKQRG